MIETRNSMKCIPYTKYFGSFFVFFFIISHRFHHATQYEKPYNERIILPIDVHLLDSVLLMAHSIYQIIVRTY